MVVFISNFLNHHQIPFCNEMNKLTKGNFKFIATIPVEEERVRLGYLLPTVEEYSYLIDVGNEAQLKEYAVKCIQTANVVILGSNYKGYYHFNSKSKQLVFRFTERPFKQLWRIFDPRVVLPILHLNSNPKCFLLCAGKYVAQDMRILHAFEDRMFFWGYFPEIIKYNSIQKLMNKKKYVSILWVARLIKWKHPEDAINVAKRLNDAGYTFTLNIIGAGPLEDTIKKSIIDLELTDSVHMLGAMSPEKVRKHMEESEIFLFTSDRNEGWGAVLNEAMNSCCAVIANQAIGSVPFLIQDYINGMIYKNGNIDELYGKVKWLIDNKLERECIAYNAYKTMIEEWNAENAANRLMMMIREIEHARTTDIYSSGPLRKVVLRSISCTNDCLADAEEE